MNSLIVKHLVDFTPVKMVYVITDLVDYFKRLGFVETKEGSKEIMGALDRVCRTGGKKNTVFMVYKKDYNF